MEHVKVTIACLGVGTDRGQTAAGSPKLGIGGDKGVIRESWEKLVLW
jgi:hypothetical protein